MRLCLSIYICIWKYGNMNIGAVSVQLALAILSDSDKQPFLDNAEK